MIHPRRLISTEPFNGARELADAIHDALMYARTNRKGEPAIEARALPVDRTLRPHFELYEETLSDKSTQLVAVVVA